MRAMRGKQAAKLMRKTCMAERRVSPIKRPLMRIALGVFLCTVYGAGVGDPRGGVYPTPGKHTIKGRYTKCVGLIVCLRPHSYTMYISRGNAARVRGGIPMANPLNDKRPDNLSGRKLTLRLSESQRERIDRRAEAMGVRASALTRAVILDFLEGKDDVPTALTRSYTGQGVELSEDVVELRKDLRRVGVNLNQLTRIANRDQRVPITVHEELRDVREVLDEILSRLGDVRA